MVEVLIESASWIIVIAIICYVANKWVKEYQEIRRSKQSFEEDKQRVELMERENKAKLEAETADERSELERARLNQEAAEAKAAAKVAEEPSTIAALAREEEMVIAARAEGRAQAERVAAQRDSDSSGDMKLLLETYESFRRDGPYANQSVRLDEWLGSIDLEELLRR